MPNANLKHYFHLHFLVFIAGFTAIIGKSVTISSTALVWYRMAIAAVLMVVYIKWSKINLRVDRKTVFKFFGAGIIIALHWVTFFESIEQANVSIALAMFSSGAFFASFIEPIFFKRKILIYEVIFGVLVIAGVLLITKSEIQYLYGMGLGLLSALFSTLFAVINGKFIENHKASVISFYEFLSGVALLSIFLFFSNDFDSSFFVMTTKDWVLIAILASVCTAYAFIGAVEVMKYISPYTVILSYNLEPVYGISLALLLFPETEKMSYEFYIGASLILITIVFDAIFKNYKRRQLKQNV